MRKYQTELKYAIMYCVMTIIWALIGKMLGFHSSGIKHNLVFNVLIFLPSLAIYYLALTEKRKKDYGGRMTFRQAFISGMVMTVFITLLGPLTPLITTIISPDLFSKSIEFVTAAGMMSRVEAQKQFNLEAFIVQGLIAAPIFGLVFSVITGLITRRS